MGLQSITSSVRCASKKTLSSIARTRSVHSMCGSVQRCCSRGRTRVGRGSPKASARDEAFVQREDSHATLPQDAEFIFSPLTPKALEEIMLDAANSVVPWEQGGFTFVRKLREASSGQVCVDLMRGPAAQGSPLVTVKRMPTAWVRKSPKEFDAKHHDAEERPWYDIGIVRKLNQIGFPYACKLQGIFRDARTTFVVSCPVTDGDLHTWCHRAGRPGHLREQYMRPIVCQIFEAVEWLHDLGIAHRDLSLESILLTQGKSGELLVRVADFGMATLSQAASGKPRGKPSYQAPEMHEALPVYDAFLCDAFALGVVLYSMAAQDYPWESTKRNECWNFEFVRSCGFRKLLEKRKFGCGESLAEVFSPGFVNILDGLLTVNPEDRLTMGELCYAEKRRSVWNEQWIEDLVEPARQ